MRLDPSRGTVLALVGDCGLTTPDPGDASPAHAETFAFMTLTALTPVQH